jgi:hypothetical protein
MNHVFDGDTFDPKVDQVRLSRQFEVVRDIMLDGEWYTFDQLRELTGYPTQSISARIRDLRKYRFGGFIIEREHIVGGLYRYRIRGKAKGKA